MAAGWRRRCEEKRKKGKKTCRRPAVPALQTGHSATAERRNRRPRKPTPHPPVSTGAQTLPSLPALDGRQSAANFPAAIQSGQQSPALIARVEAKFASGEQNFKAGHLRRPPARDFQRTPWTGCSKAATTLNGRPQALASCSAMSWDTVLHLRVGRRSVAGGRLPGKSRLYPPPIDESRPKMTFSPSTLA